MSILQPGEQTHVSSDQGGADMASDQDAVERLELSIERATHLLPAQGPITVFVHHNTLHAFQELPFAEAVQRAAEIYGCHPYLPEQQYRSLVLAGRIRPEDLVEVLQREPVKDPDDLAILGESRTQLRLAMLAYPLESGTDSEIRWLLAETSALRRFRDEAPARHRAQGIANTRRWVMRDLEKDGGRTRPHVAATLGDLHRRLGDPKQWSDGAWEAAALELLLSVVRAGVRGSGSPRTAIGTRQLAHPELVEQTSGRNVGELVDDVLIRFSLAFLDQGFANWPLPGRGTGFYRSFIALYRECQAPENWLRALPHELERIEQAGLGPLESIHESLMLLGLSSDEERDECVQETLLSLRGVAGMLWQMESNAEWTAHPAPEGTLVGYLAIRLILSRLGVAHVRAQSAGQGEDPPHPERSWRGLPHAAPSDGTEQLVFTIFQLAQVRGWDASRLDQLEPEEWSLLLSEVESFPTRERRRVYHLAYERRYRHATLDAVSHHCQRTRTVPAPQVSPAYQVVACLDEREESFRRHLEEVDPTCETFGVAGYFGVAMYYRGATEAHYRPLCPVNIKPTHYVDEEASYSLGGSTHRRAQLRHRIGRVAHRVHVGTRTMLGGLVTGLLGSLATFPLVLRVLFPRPTAAVRRMLGGMVTPPTTRLRLERLAGPSCGELHGYDVSEMTQIVESVLRGIGLTTGFSRLVVIVGHGSSSLNNPHEAAHDCGACGGGRGGPNARAFAEMANDPRVRSALAIGGLTIPQDVWFVGAYHNTCDDSMAYYDLDRLPLTNRSSFERARGALEEARRRNAHERCRRFESVGLSISVDDALRHVEGRSEDLSQTRPEYGHATNAVCFVGRRSWSRGLFLDRRAFLTSYDPGQDDEQCTILQRTLQAVIPVCAGINLEYYFSFVDPSGYGCGTKLPHNITSLVGVMNGAASDLRPGLPWQMVEIHEPVRILFVIECAHDAMERILDANAGMAQLVRNEWVQLATLDPDSAAIHVFRDGRFEPHIVGGPPPIVESSLAWYRGQRDHLGFASVAPQGAEAVLTAEPSP